MRIQQSRNPTDPFGGGRASWRQFCPGRLSLQLSYVNGTLEDVKGFCAVVDTEKIAEQDYILTPGRYVGVEEQEDDGEPFEEKMVRLTSELSDLFKQSHKLEAEIKEKLGAIGYEI